MRLDRLRHGRSDAGLHGHEHEARTLLVRQGVQQLPDRSRVRGHDGAAETESLELRAVGEVADAAPQLTVPGEVEGLERWEAREDGTWRWARARHHECGVSEQRMSLHSPRDIAAKQLIAAAKVIITRNSYYRGLWSTSVVAKVCNELQ